MLFIYEKEIRIVKLNEMCVEETKSQNVKETFIMILTEKRKIEKQNSSLWTFEKIDHYNILSKVGKKPLAILTILHNLWFAVKN